VDVCVLWFLRSCCGLGCGSLATNLTISALDPVMDKNKKWERDTDLVLCLLSLGGQRFQGRAKVGERGWWVVVL
jgi:hypothetical protein